MSAKFFCDRCGCQVGAKNGNVKENWLSAAISRSHLSIVDLAATLVGKSPDYIVCRPCYEKFEHTLRVYFSNYD